MNDAETRDYIIEQYEEKFGENPFDGWTKEEIEEFMRQLNEDFEDDHRWSGRF